MKKLLRKESGSMKKIFTFLFSICLFTMVASATNESPTVKSEIVKDGTFDFNVILSDMNLSTSTEYEWAIVENQAAIPEDSDWFTVNDWTNNTLNLYLDFSESKVYKVLKNVDTAYIVLREKSSQNVIVDHVEVDVSIPYAYGAVPYIDAGYLNLKENYWAVTYVYDASNYKMSQKIAAIKITNQSIIDGYLNLKDSSGNIDKNALANYIDSLNLTSSDIPSSFPKSDDGTLHEKNKSVGITDNALYFVWGSSANRSESTKTVYGVTIYDNGYDGSSNNIEIISNDGNTDDSTDDSTDDNVIVNSNDKKEVENPKTGMVTLGIGAVFLLVVCIVTFIVIRKKSKFPESL